MKILNKRDPRKTLKISPSDDVAIEYFSRKQTMTRDMKETKIRNLHPHINFNRNYTIETIN